MRKSAQKFYFAWWISVCINRSSTFFLKRKATHSKKLKKYGKIYLYRINIYRNRREQHARKLAKNLKDVKIAIKTPLNLTLFYHNQRFKFGLQMTDLSLLLIQMLTNMNSDCWKFLISTSFSIILIVQTAFVIWQFQNK